MVAEIEDEKTSSGKSIIAHTVWDFIAVGGKKTAALRKELEGDARGAPETFDCSQRRDADWHRIEYYPNHQSHNMGDTRTRRPSQTTWDLHPSHQSSDFPLMAALRSWYPIL